MKHVITAKERVNCYGIRETIYKEGKRPKLRIIHPNKFCEGFRVQGLGWCYDPKPTYKQARESAEAFLTRVYSIFGGCTINYI